MSPLSPTTHNVAESADAEILVTMNNELEDSKIEKDGTFHLWQEAKTLLKIALPAVAVQFSVLFIFPQTASLVGTTLGTESLGGFSLGSLVGNLTCMSVMVGALTAADTLMPRAYGTGNYAEIGRLAIRGFVMCSFLLLFPIVPLWTCIESVFDMLGQDALASHLAAKWIRMFLLGVPCTLVFRVTQSFLNAQQIVWPLVYASLTASILFHPICVRVCVAIFGFTGSGLAISITQCFMVAFLMIYLRINPVHKKESWPPLTYSFVMEAISPGPMMKFSSLSLGGVFALSEWWFWETVCFIVGSFGVVPLCVHTIAYNLVPLLFMIPLGIVMGLQVRIGNVIVHDVKKAKLLAAWCMFYTTILGAVVSLLLFQFRIQIAGLFSSDPAVIQGCKDIWPKLCYHIFILFIFGINSAILRALGQQWIMAAIIFGTLWLGTLPTIAFVAVQQGGGIDAVWTIMPIFYTIMQFFMAASYMLMDWEKIAQEIREHSVHKVAAGDELTTESTSLL